MLDELRPAREAVFTREHPLSIVQPQRNIGIRKHRRDARDGVRNAFPVLLLQRLRLVAQVVERRTLGQRTTLVGREHGYTFPSVSPAVRSLQAGSEVRTRTEPGGLGPSRGRGGVPDTRMRK